MISHIHEDGAHILVPVLRGLSAYPARTLHMFRDVLIDVYLCYGTYSSCFGKSARYAVNMCVRTSFALLHRHWRSFIVIGISFRAIVMPTVSLWEQSEAFLVNHTHRLTYFLSIANYCFSFNICLKWKSPVGTYTWFTNRCPFDALIGRKLFLSSWKVQLLRVDFFEFAVSSGNLRLRMRWV